MPLAVELLKYIAVIPVSFELLFNKELMSNGSVLLAHEFTSWCYCGVESDVAEALGTGTRPADDTQTFDNFIV